MQTELNNKPEKALNQPLISVSNPMKKLTIRVRTKFGMRRVSYPQFADFTAPTNEADSRDQGTVSVSR